MPPKYPFSAAKIHNSPQTAKDLRGIICVSDSVSIDRHEKNERCLELGFYSMPPLTFGSHLPNLLSPFDTFRQPLDWKG